MVLWVDGEKIVDVEPHIGYLHRGSEKLCEGEQYHQVITLFDRLDYVANFNNELVYCQAVEKLMGLEVPEPLFQSNLLVPKTEAIASSGQPSASRSTKVDPKANVPSVSWAWVCDVMPDIRTPAASVTSSK